MNGVSKIQKSISFSKIYISGIKDGIAIIERGVFAGLSYHDSIECLKKSIVKTEEEQEND